MSKTTSILDNLAFAVEDSSEYGGSQRLAAILAKRFDKPLYCINKSDTGKICWNVKVINSIPKEPTVLSVTVDKYHKPIMLKSKRQIKFMHSLGTVDFDKRYAKFLKQFIWVTHRERVYKMANRLNFRTHLIKDGYILYDYKKLPILSIKHKEDSIISISRICTEKNIDKVIRLSDKTDLPITILGYYRDTKYFRKIKKFAKGKRKIRIIGKVTEQDKVELLKKSKLLVNATSGKYRDYLEYSILDGMLYGCIPICITQDSKQFDIIEKKDLGIIITDVDAVENAIKKILNNYEYYYANCRRFMNWFLNRQDRILKAYENSFVNLMNIENQ